jgi:plasmid stabilization system protein ParE
MKLTRICTTWPYSSTACPGPWNAHRKVSRTPEPVGQWRWKTSRALPRIQISRAAAADLERLILTHSLPNDTRQRFKRAVRPLGQFPRLGPELTGRWAGFRFVLGPWRWMLVVYVHLEDENRVVVVTIQDARSSIAERSSIKSPGSG